MNPSLRSLVLAAVGAGSLTLAAQTAPEGAPGRPQRGAPPIVAALDANQDGVLDTTEIANASTALTSLDANQDGQISPEEFHPPGRGRGGRPGGPGPEGPGGPGGPRRAGGGGGPLAGVLDANQDGTLDATEIANAPAALASLDTDADGQLTPEELHPQHPEGRPEGGPGKGGKRGPRGQRPGSGSGAQ